MRRQSVRTDFVVLLPGPGREIYRPVVAAVERFGRGHHPRLFAGRVGQAIDVDVSGAGEGHRSFECALLPGMRCSRRQVAVGLWLQRDHLPEFGQ